MKKFFSRHIEDLSGLAVMAMHLFFRLAGVYDGISKFLLRYSVTISSNHIAAIFLCTMVIVLLVVMLPSGRRE